jgi:hypothetical protein
MVVVAQLVERQVVILDVAGSSPVDHPKLDVGDPLRRVVFVGYSFTSQHALLAQLAEHRTLNPQVLGSIPRERTFSLSRQFPSTVMRPSQIRRLLALVLDPVAGDPQ